MFPACRSSSGSRVMSSSNWTSLTPSFSIKYVKTPWAVSGCFGGAANWGDVPHRSRLYSTLQTWLWRELVFVCTIYNHGREGVAGLGYFELDRDQLTEDRRRRWHGSW